MAQLLLLAFVWLSTMLLQVPRHHARGLGFDPSARSFLVLGMAARVMG